MDGGFDEATKSSELSMVQAIREDLQAVACRSAARPAGTLDPHAPGRRQRQHPGLSAGRVRAPDGGRAARLGAGGAPAGHGRPAPGAAPPQGAGPRLLEHAACAGVLLAILVWQCFDLLCCIAGRSVKRFSSAPLSWHTGPAARRAGAAGAGQGGAVRPKCRPEMPAQHL